MPETQVASLAIQIVTLNSADVIDACLESLSRQTHSDFQVVVVDNGSEDDSASRVATWLDAGSVPGLLIRAGRNLGFCGGHNRLLETHDAPWVLLLNPDARLPDDFVARACERIAVADPDVGTLAPRILLEDGRIDSTGLFLDRFRRVFDRGQAHRSQECYLEEEDVFGGTGAVVLHRRTMLQDIALDGEALDELIFAYYDDLDVAWRAQLRGWRCRYCPDLIATHARAGRNAVRPLAGRSGEAREQRLAIRNRLLVLLRCEQTRHLLLALPWLLPYELARLAYIALRVPGGLGAYADLLRVWSAVRRARRQIQARARVEKLRGRSFFPHARRDRS